MSKKTLKFGSIQLPKTKQDTSSVLVISEPILSTSPLITQESEGSSGSYGSMEPVVVENEITVSKLKSVLYNEESRDSFEQFLAWKVNIFEILFFILFVIFKIIIYHFEKYFLIIIEKYFFLLYNF